jgi:hypothetical protein
VASIFGWRVPIPPQPPVLRTMAAGGGPAWNRVPFTMEQQSQTSWCWAATATSVALYFKPNPRWTQCQVASKVLSLPSCCSSPARCNQASYLDKALNAVGHFSPPVTSPITAAAVNNQLTARRPVPIRIGWSGGGGHFVAISGVLLGAQVYVGMEDPRFGHSDVPLQTLSGSYQGSGSWTNTYPVH